MQEVKLKKKNYAVWSARYTKGAGQWFTKNIVADTRALATVVAKSKVVNEGWHKFGVAFHSIQPSNTLAKKIDQESLELHPDAKVVS